MAIQDYIVGVQQPIVNPLAGRDNNAVVANSIESFLGANSPLIQNARQRGVEYAATRGGINSSIAAGAAERSAMEAATPLAQTALSMQQQQDAVTMDDWTSKQNFNRSLYGQQISSSLGMLNRVQDYALQDPSLYTPEVTSGMSNFFQKNMNDIMSRYFAGIKTGG